jgi:K+/H+ antiporter YhaU regulatory subunit KhtT
LPQAVFDEKKSAATSALVKIDPKAIESLQVAAQKIGEARDLGNEPELDAALKSLKRLRDSQIDNALKALSEAYKTNKSTELNSAINQLEQITK